MISIQEQYRQHVERTTAIIKGLSAQINRYALFRLAAIVGGAVAIFKAVQTEEVWLVLVVAVAVMLLFMWLVFKHSKLDKEKSRYTDFLVVNQNELDIIDGNVNVYPDGASFKKGTHPYGEDLDVYGAASLFSLVNRAASPQANEMLASWLGQPSVQAQIHDRQAAVKELAADLDWCQSYQTDMFFELSQKTPARAIFARLLDASQLRFGSAFLRGYVKVAPFLFVVSLLLTLFSSVFTLLLLFFAFGHLLLSLWYAGKVGKVSSTVDRAGRLLGAYAAAFAHIEKREWKSALARELHGKLKFNEGRDQASVVFKELAGLINKLDYRLNMLVGAVLNMVFLWDFKQVFAILDWRDRYEEEILEAFDVTAEFEVLVSFAILSRNHPDWAFPDVRPPAEEAMEGEALSHPLIPETKAVANDYHRDEHRIALITGSNMAGKSTFLRTIGANTVLALAGAPVCAKRMEVSVFRMVTYMRIKDSLNESTSTFKAELDRMQMILQTVKTQPDTYFLIDEMLRGTNSVDKYLGSKAIIKKLIADNGIGMVATHDLKLAELEKAYPDAVRNYHFDIQVIGGEMLFDYKLKHGECTIFNASLLLKGIGVEVEPEG